MVAVFRLHFAKSNVRKLIAKWTFVQVRANVGNRPLPTLAISRQMLLVKFTEHIKTQNWLAVCLDFVIVVAGVYLGIQISNWNESRQDAERGARYLERIYTDLSSDLERMDISVEYWSKVIEYGTAAIAYAESGQLFDSSAKKTVLAFFQASQILPYVTNSTTYMEMRSSGDLGLIENDALRESLAEYYTAGIDAGASHLTQLVPEYRENIRGLTPFAIQEFVWQNCVEQSGQFEKLVDCTLPISDEIAGSVLETFVMSPSTMMQLRFWISNEVVAVQVIRRYRDQAESLLQQVGTELGV